jgi:putative phosphoesterase
MRRIGLISDTHGLLRPEALAFLRGCDHIVHGGDIGERRILDELAAIAPLTAVRGNNDTGPWAHDVPETALIELAGVRIFAIHDIAQMSIDPVGAGIHVVVSGHSHRPLAQDRGGILYVNPGSAGPRRFRLPICAAELRLDGGSITPRIVELLAG